MKTESLRGELGWLCGVPGGSEGMFTCPINIRGPNRSLRMVTILPQRPRNVGAETLFVDCQSLIFYKWTELLFCFSLWKSTIQQRWCEIFWKLHTNLKWWIEMGLLKRDHTAPQRCHSGFFAWFMLLWPGHDYFSGQINLKGLPLKKKTNQYMVRQSNSWKIWMGHN